jgi:hypothetical protein
MISMSSDTQPRLLDEAELNLVSGGQPPPPPPNFIPGGTDLSNPVSASGGPEIIPVIDMIAQEVESTVESTPPHDDPVSHILD